MRSTALKSIVGYALSLFVALGAGCATGGEASDTTARPTERQACRTDLPATWADALGNSMVDVGGVSAVPLTVGTTGEVVAVRDDGSMRDVLLIPVIGAPTPIYAVPEPDQDDVQAAVMDDRRVVIGLGHSPRGANGIIPAIERIDVISRHGEELRSVAETSEEDRRSGGPTIDSVALFDGAVYWITRDTFASKNGTLKSLDLAHDTVADVASGPMTNVRATAAGLILDVGWGAEGTTSEVKVAAALPGEVADAVGNGTGRLGLATDGEVYAWLDGATDLSWWSPNSGLTRIVGDVGGKAGRLPDIWVAGPLVVIDGGNAATVVDVRSGAVVGLPATVVGLHGGTMAMTLPRLPGGGKLAPTMPAMLRTETLSPVTC